MSARAIDAANLPTMLRIQVRTGWKSLLAWVGAAVALMAITATSMQGTYDTPAKVASYAQTIGAGPAIEMMNGQVAGINTLGGIIANEYGFIASFVLPIMGIALVARATRREEEAGRLELLLAATIGRHAPVVAALLVALTSAAVMGLGCWLVMLPLNLDHTGAAWYGAGLAALVLVFSAATAVAAQLFESTRSVWTSVLGVALLSYLVRGVGSVNDGWYRLLTPHGLLDAINSFGQPRAWPFCALLAVALAGMAAAVVLNAHRDLGGGMVAPRQGRARARANLRNPWGLTLHEHRGAIVGWSLGAGAVMAIYGSLAQQVMDALAANPALSVYVSSALDEVMAMFVMMGSMLASAAVLAGAGALRSSETSGRLEAQLAGPVRRLAWLARHGLVIGAGGLLVLGLAGVVLAGAASASLGNGAVASGILRASGAHAVVVLAFAALALAVFAWAPALRALLWALFGVGAFVAYMGQALKLPDWLVDNSPFMLVGRVPATGIDWWGVAILAMITVAVLVVAGIGMRGRDVPRL